LLARVPHLPPPISLDVAVVGLRKACFAEQSVLSTTPGLFALSEDFDGQLVERAPLRVQVVDASEVKMPAAPVLLADRPAKPPVVSAFFAVITAEILMATAPVLLLDRPGRLPIL